MQVRKFEAKTMKDALELVKQHLGPEAIILSAKDNSRGFGLMGEKSVEVTAAISNDTLRRKKLAEAKLREVTRERFSQSSAKVQRQFINKVFETRPTVMANAAAEPVRRPVPSQRYIDIYDEETIGGGPSGQRIKEAAMRARSASAAVIADLPKSRTVQSAMTAATKNRDVSFLEAQIGELKVMIENFQKIPQSMVSAHPGAEDGIPYELTGAFQKLRQSGIQASLVIEWLKAANKDMDREHLKKSALVDAWLVQKILREAAITRDPMGGRYHVFLGTTAQGKTSTLVKMASQLVLKEKKRIALVSTDTLKVGAADQLKIYAQILNVPFAVVRHPSEWALLDSRVKDVHHILVDAPGMGLKTMEEVEWLKHLLPPATNRKVHFVQSAVARDEEVFELASRYRMIGFDDVIFTRLDETVQHGLIVNFQKHFQTQLHSFGTGTQIPEDFEWATKERVADLIFKISKLKKREVSI
jgi:flagellar biosynthesis protein FlhF